MTAVTTVRITEDDRTAPFAVFLPGAIGCPRDRTWQVTSRLPDGHSFPVGTVHDMYRIDENTVEVVVDDFDADLWQLVPSVAMHGFTEHPDNPQPLVWHDAEVVGFVLRELES